MHEFKKGDMAIYVGPDDQRHGDLVEVMSNITRHEVYTQPNFHGLRVLDVYLIQPLICPTLLGNWAALPEHLKPITDPDAEIETVNDEEIIA